MSLALPIMVLAATAAGARGPRIERVSAGAVSFPEVVTAVYQDRTGLIWVGSREGLIVYDGTTSTTFEHDPDDLDSISDNSIRTIYEDRSGALWIGTNTGGLDRLDLASRKFRHFRHAENDPASLGYDSVYAIAEDARGWLWVGTQRGLNRLDPDAGTFERFPLPEPYVTSLLVDRDGRLWVGTLGGGLAVRDAASGTFANHRHDAADQASLADDRVFALLADPSGDLWVGTAVGVDRLDRGSGRFRHVKSELVTSLAPGLPGKLWFGTFGDGLDELDTATGSAHPLRAVSDGIGVGSDRITALMSDGSGTLWIATWGAGLNRIRQGALRFSSASAGMSAPPGVSDVEVSSVGTDRRGGLWIGTAAGPLLRYDAGAAAWTRFDRGLTDTAYALFETSDGLIWAGTNRGLTRLDPRSGATHKFEHDPSDPRSLGAGYTSAFLEDREGRRWVGTGEGGLQQIDAEGRVVERHLREDYVTAILEDRHGTLWVGTRSSGLVAFDPRTGRDVRYRPVPGDPRSLSSLSITPIFEDAHGRLWVGTAGGGLNRVEPASEGAPARFTRFTTTDGLADNNVMAILEDDDETLWISTKRGLSRFDARTAAFANFLVADGLPSAEFTSRAAARVGNALYFGSVKWLASVKAGTPFPPRIPSPIVITSVRGSTAELTGERPAWRLANVSIPYGEWLSLELAVLDYAPELKHAYAYRLGGTSAPWVDLGTRSSITFTDLAPGTYAFTAKGRNDQGVWSDLPRPLTITVVPPFWRTLWFRAGLVAGLAFAGVLVHQVRTASLKRRNRELVELHDRLRLLARRLELAKEDERKSIARELHDELGPTLTAVVINLQLLKDTAEAERRARRIADTVEIVDRMVQRVREISLDLRPPLLDEMGLLTALRGYLETLAARSGLAVEMRGGNAMGGLTAEVEIVAFRVVQEAVTNVVRHAGATRAIVTVERNDSRLRIEVEDDGKGFDVGASLGSADTGKALGLLGMQERVLMLAGRLDIVSTPGRGTIVRVTLPVPGAS